MATSLNALAAQEHIADLHRAANRDANRAENRAANGRRNGRAGLRRAHRKTPGPAGSTAAVRFTYPDEARTLQRLAQLDDAAELTGEILVATIDDDVVAGLSLDDGRVVANPFVLTSGAVELLRRNAKALTGQRGLRPWRSVLRPRLA